MTKPWAWSWHAPGRSSAVVSVQIPLDLVSPPDYSGAAFIHGASNTEAVNALSDSQAWANNLLAIVGPKGCGKTHLGHVWADRENAIILDGADGFVPRRDYRGRSLWIDNGSQADEYALFTLINLAITGEIKALLLCARDMPATWQVQLPDLRSRLRNVQIAQLQEPDEAVLHAIITKLFKDRGLVVSDSLIAYLLSHADRSVSGLRSLITEMDKKAASEKVNVTRTFAAKYMQGKLF